MSDMLKPEQRHRQGETKRETATKASPTGRIVIPRRKRRQGNDAAKRNQAYIINEIFSGRAHGKKPRNESGMTSRLGRYQDGGKLKTAAQRRARPISSKASSEKDLLIFISRVGSGGVISKRHHVHLHKISLLHGFSPFSLRYAYGAKMGGLAGLSTFISSWETRVYPARLQILQVGQGWPGCPPLANPTNPVQTANFAGWPHNPLSCNGLQPRTRPASPTYIGHDGKRNETRKICTSVCSLYRATLPAYIMVKTSAVSGFQGFNRIPLAKKIIDGARKVLTKGLEFCIFLFKLSKPIRSRQRSKAIMETHKQQLIDTYKGIIASYQTSPIYNSISDTGRLYRRNASRYAGYVKKLEESQKKA